MNRIVLGLLILAILGCAAFGLFRWNESANRTDQERIGDLIEAAALDFSAARLSCTEAFHEDFHESTLRLSRSTIRAAVAYALRFGHKRSFRLHAARESVSVEIIEPGAKAKAHFRLELYELFGLNRPEKSIWVLDVDCDLRATEPSAWKFYRSRHRTVSGRAPR